MQTIEEQAPASTPIEEVEAAIQTAVGAVADKVVETIVPAVEAVADKVVETIEETIVPAIEAKSILCFSQTIKFLKEKTSSCSIM
jgi:hypothetical protein